MPEFLEFSDAERRLIELVVNKYYQRIMGGTQFDSPDQCVRVYNGLMKTAIRAMQSITTNNGRISDAILNSDVEMVDFITSEHITKYLTGSFMSRHPEIYDVLWEAYSFRSQAALACTQDKSVSFAETENERAFK